MVKEDDDVSLEDLTVAPAELLPIPRGKAPKPNPMAEHLEKSWDKPLGVVKPANQALAIGRALRKAAMRERHGVTIQYHALPGEVYTPESKVKDLPATQDVRVVFQAREKGQHHEDDS